MCCMRKKSMLLLPPIQQMSQLPIQDLNYLLSAVFNMDQQAQVGHLPEAVSSGISALFKHVMPQKEFKPPFCRGHALFRRQSLLMKRVPMSLSLWPQKEPRMEGIKSLMSLLIVVQSAL